MFVLRSEKLSRGWPEEPRGGTEPIDLRSRGVSTAGGRGAVLVVDFGGGPGGGPGRVVGAWGAVGTALGMLALLSPFLGKPQSKRPGWTGYSRGPDGVGGLDCGSVSTSIASGLGGFGCAGVVCFDAGIRPFGASESSVSSWTAAAVACAGFLAFFRSASAMDIRRLGTVPRVGDVLPLLRCGNAQCGSRNCFAHSSLENFTCPPGRADCSFVSFFGGWPGGGGGNFENRFVSLVDERV